MSDWLRAELTRELAPARAPHDLWIRVNQARFPEHSRPRRTWRISPRMAFWPVAALVIAGTIAAWGLVERHAPIDFAQMALADLQASELASLQSSDGAEISAWFRRNAALDVSLPQSNAAHISGARIVKRDGVEVGEVFYRVQGKPAALLVSKPAKGVSVKPVQSHGHRTWESRGVTYALACAAPESDRIECLLCHTAAL